MCFVAWRMACEIARKDRDDCGQREERIRQVRWWHGCGPRTTVPSTNGQWRSRRFFYRNLPMAAQVEQAPLMTFDADWTVPAPLAKRLGQLLDLSLRGAHFVGMLHGEDAPVVFYQHERHGTTKLAPIHVEFLVPRYGSPKDRKGRDRTSVQAQPGLWTQALPYLDLLLQETITMDASAIEGLALPTGRTILLPHPATYVIQEVLCRAKRQPDKRDKDLAYIYDVATLTRNVWPDIAVVVDRLHSRGRFPAKWFVEARKILARLFDSPNRSTDVNVGC